MQNSVISVRQLEAVEGKARYGVIDGLHRVCALKELEEEARKSGQEESAFAKLSLVRANIYNSELPDTIALQMAHGMVSN